MLYPYCVTPYFIGHKKEQNMFAIPESKMAAVYNSKRRIMVNRPWSSQEGCFVCKTYQVALYFKALVPMTTTYNYFFLNSKMTILPVIILV